ncbi:general substrate transporter [Calocera cornea HHB12733]|uniref:General substrate transporter n=1 Tax=Calocera cornea HHB12733 TaxID=1353952 RepID=A0A165G450_9BASI|nr:general substrate transporter [Calocera cornea HHB12733]
MEGQGGIPVKRRLIRDIRVYAVASSAFLGLILDGYDTGIAGGVVSNAWFQNQFGLTASNANDLSSNVVSVLQAGAFFGSLISGFTAGWFGRKWTLVGSSLVFIVGAILATIAKDQHTRGLAYIYAGRVICGLGVGAMSSIGPLYAAEIAPKAIRGRVVGLFMVNVATGVLLSYWVNYGVAIHSPPDSAAIWQIPFGVQILPAGLMFVTLLFCKESPRYLAIKGRTQEAIDVLCWYRRAERHDDEVKGEIAEIEATILEEREARDGVTWTEAFFGKGNWPRFLITFLIMLFQQFSGQNLVNYYGPQLFKSIGYVGQTPALLATGVYGVVKLVASFIFVWWVVDKFGRRWSLFCSSFGMGVCFIIVGALYLTHPPDPNAATPSGASRAMAGMIYLYCFSYAMGTGALPFVYCSEIFSNRVRHLGLGWAGMNQWIWNFTISRTALNIETGLGGKTFICFGIINIFGLSVLAYFLPETKGRTLEEMDVIFGSIKAEDRKADIDRAEIEIAADLKATDIEMANKEHQPGFAPTSAPVMPIPAKEEATHIEQS